MITRLPPKRLRPRSGIERAPKREHPRHRKFVRSLGCCVEDCTQLPIEFSHLRTAANSGVALKPHDAFGVGMCGCDPSKGQEGHHAEYHRIGHNSFEKKYTIDLRALAAVYVKASPDIAMKDSLKLVELENA